MARAIDWAVSFSLVCEDSETWKLLGFQLTSAAVKLIIPKDQINHLKFSEINRYGFDSGLANI